MLVLVSLVKAICEILAVSFLGRGVLRLVARRTRASVAYRLFSAPTRPLLRLVRRFTPRAVPDRYVWLIAVLLLLLVWIFAATRKLELCRTHADASPLCGQTLQVTQAPGGARR